MLQNSAENLPCYIACAEDTLRATLMVCSEYALTLGTADHQTIASISLL